MPESIEQFRLRLIELGCPVRRLQRAVREMAEHREDLLEALVAEGMAAAEAEARADERLGDPQKLAEDLMESLRRSSWCGRHRLIAFGLLPTLVFPLFWLTVLVLNLSLAYALGFGWDQKRLHTAASNPLAFQYMSMVAHAADYLSIALVAAGFCMLAGRAPVRRSWILFGGVTWAVYSLFIYTYVTPHDYTIGVSTDFQWTRAAIPLLIFGYAHAKHVRQVRHVLNPAAEAI